MRSEQTQYLVARWVAGATAQQIGDELGVTRNAVAGWIFRHPLAAEQQAQRALALARERPAPTSVQRRKARALRARRYQAKKKTVAPIVVAAPRQLYLKPPPEPVTKDGLRRDFERAWANTARLAVGHGTRTV